VSYWHKDFKWSRHGVIVKETNVFVPFNTSLFKDLASWLPYAVVEWFRSIFRRTSFEVSFTPRPARSWYLIRAVLTQAGARIIDSNDKADLSIYFHDTTIDTPPPRPSARHHINYDCTDISKSHVARVFAEVFGYALAVDPTTYDGLLVRKSEKNGAHDGSVHEGPIEFDPDWVYQRLIDTETDRGTVMDLRCPTVFGSIPLVYIKERPIEKRFANMNSTCRLAKPEDYFSPEELSQISQFCEKMRLDWGGLDILRDRQTNRLYIVDVNKTDMGPPLALPMKDKLKSTTILARALTHAINVDMS